MSSNPTLNVLSRCLIAAPRARLRRSLARLLTAGFLPIVSVAGGSYSGNAWAESAPVDSFGQWSIVPLSGARLESGARLDARQEIRFSTASTGPLGYYGFNNLWSDSMRPENSVGLDQPRATYRYTWLSMREFDLKVGLTSNLSQFGPSLRSGFSSPLRFGALPQMHLSGVGRLTENWLVTLDSDSLWTTRGRSLDLGLHLDYNLSHRFQFFGGYRLTDFVGDAEDFYGSTTVNTANVGLRYRF